MSATQASTARSTTKALRAVLTAYAVSQLGNWLFRAGVIYEVYNQSHGSVAVLTAAILLIYLPILVGSRLLAPLVDRWETRRVLITLDLARAVLLSGLFAAVLASQGLGSGFALFTLGVLCLLSPMFGASQTAYLRRSLPSSDMPRAFAAVSKVDWLTFVFGTVAGPIVLELTNVPQLVAMDVATFVVSALFLRTLTPAPPVPTSVAATSDTEAGRRLSAATRRTLLTVALLNTGAGLINVYPNVVTRDFLSAGAGVLGLVNLADGVGGYVGATIAGRIKDDRKRRPVLTGAVIVAVSLVIMSAAGFVPAVLFGSALMLLGGQVFAVSAQARMVQDEPVDQAGRVSGYFTLATFGGVTVSTLAFPLAARLGPVHETFPWLLLAGAACAALAAFRVRDRARDEGCGDGEDGDRASASVDDLPVSLEGASDTLAVTPKGYDATPAKGSIEARLRTVGSQFATGVTVVTAAGSAGPHAMTANSFTTVSVVPPMVLVCVRRDARMAKVLRAGVPVGFSVLSARQQDVAGFFADSRRGLGKDQFNAHAWSTGPVTGVPFLDKALAWFECEVEAIVPAGDHDVILARVLGMEADPSSADPLVFFRGRFHEGVA